MKLADLDKHGFDWNKILDFCKKNIRYISAGIIVVILVVVLSVTTVNPDKQGEGSKEGNQTSQESQESGQNEAFAIDAIPEINTLIQNYYSAYAAGDIATIESLATPISDIEKSYITLMSQYISGYENIQVHTKKGLLENEYMVSVAMEMGFEGLTTTAPGLDFFYVRMNGTGAYAIDNLYSQFNYQNRENELDSQVEAFIANYEKQDDVVQLCNDVQTRYEAALKADADLKNMIDVTIPQALEEWVTQITGGAGQTGDAQTPPADSGQTPAEGIQPQQPENSGANSIPAGKEISLNKSMNIRKEMSETSDLIDVAKAGDKVTVVESYAEGWTKVQWNGKTGYIRTDLLLNN